MNPEIPNSISFSWRSPYVPPGDGERSLPPGSARVPQGRALPHPLQSGGGGQYNGGAGNAAVFERAAQSGRHTGQPGAARPLPQNASGPGRESRGLESDSFHLFYMRQKFVSITEKRVWLIAMLIAYRTQCLSKFWKFFPYESRSGIRSMGPEVIVLTPDGSVICICFAIIHNWCVNWLKQEI